MAIDSTTHPIAAHLRRYLLPAMHVAVLAVSILLIAYITYDTLLNISFISNPRYLRVQLWACIFFIVEILVESMLAPKPWRALLRNIPFILICIPYINILHHCNIAVTPEISYLLRFVPMIRAAYVLAIMWGFMSKNWISSMFGAYIIMLVTTLYFLSLMFFVEEHFVNPGVTDYWQSLWFSIMQMTTCGSSISPITPTGKVIGVVLSAEGLILFPVFTVYFTHAFARNHSTAESTGN